MKKIGLIVLGLTSQIIFAQANRFIYQVTMKTDSTNRSEIKTENAYLDVTPEKSIFYGEKRLQRDSLFTRMRQTNGGSFDRTQMQNLRSYIDFTIEKDFKTGKNTYNSRIARDQYSYDEDRTMEWKILAETAKIGDYKTQKAQTNFGGRTWFAWFTTDVPFQDGPYKFSGLPGLIVKVEDSKGDYSFDLKETKKIGALTNLSQGGNIVKVKRKDYEKQEALFRKDPASFMQTSMRGGSGISAPQTRGGSMRTPDPAQRKQMEDRMKEEMKKNNNPIELK